MSAILAKAMNSTMGTSDFKAFDQLLMRDASISKSTNVIYTIPFVETPRIEHTKAAQDEPGKIEKEILSFRIRAVGTFSLSAIMNAFGNSGGTSVYIYNGIKVYRNGELVSTTVWSIMASNSVVGKTITTDVPCLPGDIFSVRLYYEESSTTTSYVMSGYCELYSLKILGTVSESAFDIV